jgi:uncharacterized membrane protein YfcA
MDDFLSYLLTFLMFSFIIETMVLIGVFVGRRPNEEKRTKKKIPLLSILTKFHQMNMNAKDDGYSLKETGLYFIYLGTIASIFEVIYCIYFTNNSLNLIETVNHYFITISPGITILAAGFAIYAFGVTLVENQRNKK